MAVRSTQSSTSEVISTSPWPAVRMEISEFSWRRSMPVSSVSSKVGPIIRRSAVNETAGFPKWGLRRERHRDTYGRQWNIK